MSYLTTELGSFMRPLSDQQAAIRNLLEEEDDEDQPIRQKKKPARKSKENTDPTGRSSAHRPAKGGEPTPKNHRQPLQKSPTKERNKGQQTTPSRSAKSDQTAMSKTMEVEESTTPIRKRGFKKESSPAVVVTPKIRGQNKAGKEKKRQRSSGGGGGESEAERSRKESPKVRPKETADHPKVDSPRVQKKGGVLSSLQIDMVQGTFQPDTPKRKRRTPVKPLYDEDSSPDFVERKQPGKKPSGGASKAGPAPAGKKKLAVSTIKNYESDQDISSEEDSDVYQSGNEQSSTDDEDSQQEETPKRKAGKKEGKVKKAAGEGNVKKAARGKKKGVAVTKVAGKRMMTPRVPSRSVPLPDVVSPLQEAQLRLHVGAVPDSLPCREDEFAEIFSFTEGKIQEGIGGCMYISGLPGTGKTATVKEVLRTLQEDKKEGGLPDFNFIEINGMRLTEPNQAYVQIWQGLTGGEKVTPEHARNLLEARFTGADKKSGKKTVTTVLVVDELDMLWNKKQSVLYNVFEWPTYKWAKLVVLAIANTMDLPERVMINRVSSRIGLTRLNFSPYTHEQLTEIVAARLHGLSVFDKDAVNLVARKVSSLSGDARRALDICRRATEIAQRHHERHLAAAKSTKKKTKGTDESEASVVGMGHVTQAHKEMFCSPKMMAIRCCSPFEKMFLQTLVAIFEKTGIEETSLGRARELLTELAVVDGYAPVTVTQAHSVLARLINMRLVLGEPGKSGRLDMKIRLNVSTDDVNFALKKEYA